MANPGRRRSLIWVPAFAGMSGLLAVLGLAACTQKPTPADTYAEARAALQKRLGPKSEVHYVSTAITHGKTSICGYAGAPAAAGPDRRFVFTDGTLTLDSDEDSMAFERRVAKDCPDFVSARPLPARPVRD